MDQDHRSAAPGVCPACGAPYPAEGAGCPVCLMHGALGSEAAGEGGPQNQGLLQPEADRFDHYVLRRHEGDGAFEELGRGAMGVTYRALDTVLGRPVALHAALMGQWHHSLDAHTLPATMQIAQRLYSLAQEQQQNAALMVGACNALGMTFFFLGDFEAARRYLGQALELWRSGGVPSLVEEVDVRAVSCLCYKADCDWHLGEIASSHATLLEAICLAKKLNDAHGLAEGLAEALACAASLGHSKRDPAEVERYTSELMELATQHRFATWRAVAAIYGGWARSASGDTAGGLAWIDEGLRRWQATGAVRVTPVWLTLKAEALHFAGHTGEALKALREAETLIESSDERQWSAELHRLRGVFLTAMGADEAPIEAAFSEAIRTAQQQQSISLLKRAEASYVEYRCSTVKESGGTNIQQGG